MNTLARLGFAFWFENVSSNDFRFDGATFKTEPSSQFSHLYVGALGSYRNSPFVTGGYYSTDGLKTEILFYDIGEWIQAPDYPFSNTNR